MWYNQFDDFLTHCLGFERQITILSRFFGLRCPSFAELDLVAFTCRNCEIIVKSNSRLVEQTPASAKGKYCQRPWIGDGILKSCCYKSKFFIDEKSKNFKILTEKFDIFRNISPQLNESQYFKLYIFTVGVCSDTVVNRNLLRTVSRKWSERVPV